LEKEAPLPFQKPLSRWKTREVIGSSTEHGKSLFSQVNENLPESCFASLSYFNGAGEVAIEEKNEGEMERSMIKER
jgi:hypothetical protein